MDQQPLIDTNALFAPKKGKQATKGQKQIFEENKETIAFYSKIAITSLMLKVAYEIVFSSIFSTKLNFFLVLFAIITQGGALASMYYMAKPVLAGASKSVVDGGIDLNLKDGFTEHLKDLIITTAICSVASIHSNGWWLLWLWLPMFLVYKIWMTVVAPWIFAPAPEPVPKEVADKKRRKLERKMARNQGR